MVSFFHSYFVFHNSEIFHLVRLLRPLVMSLDFSYSSITTPFRSWTRSQKRLQTVRPSCRLPACVIYSVRLFYPLPVPLAWPRFSIDSDSIHRLGQRELTCFEFGLKHLFHLLCSFWIFEFKISEMGKKKNVGGGCGTKSASQPVDRWSSIESGEAKSAG